MVEWACKRLSSGALMKVSSAKESGALSMFLVGARRSPVEEDEPLLG